MPSSPTSTPLAACSSCAAVCRERPALPLASPQCVFAASSSSRHHDNSPAASAEVSAVVPRSRGSRLMRAAHGQGMLGHGKPLRNHAQSVAEHGASETIAAALYLVSRNRKAYEVVAKLTRSAAPGLISRPILSHTQKRVAKGIFCIFWGQTGALRLYGL